jgi:putative transposase
MSIYDRSNKPVLRRPLEPGTYTANAFTKLCGQLGIRQSMGRVGSCFDNAAAEAFFSSLEWEVLSRHEFENVRQAQAVVLDWCYGFYNHDAGTARRA